MFKSLALSWDTVLILFLCCCLGIVVNMLLRAYNNPEFKLKNQTRELILSAVLAAVFSLILLTPFGLYIILFLVGIGLFKYVIPALIKKFI